MELRQRIVEAERLVGVALQADGAVVVGAGADQPAAGREQLPAAGDVGEVLLLVLGQKNQAERPLSPRSLRGAPTDQPAVRSRSCAGL